jgi:hypothetical protein
LILTLFLCFYFVVVDSRCWVKLGHHGPLPRLNALSLESLWCWLGVIHWLLFNSILNIWYNPSI